MVFVSDRERRARSVRLGGSILALLLGGYLSALALSLVGAGSVGVPGLPLLPSLRPPALEPHAVGNRAHQPVRPPASQPARVSSPPTAPAGSPDLRAVSQSRVPGADGMQASGPTVASVSAPPASVGPVTPASSVPTAAQPNVQGSPGTGTTTTSTTSTTQPNGRSGSHPTPTPKSTGGPSTTVYRLR